MDTEQTPQPSKVKNILLIVLVFTTLLFFVYGYIQKLEADKQREIAVANLMEAQRQSAEAEKMRLTAQYAQREAETQRVLAMQAVEQCEKSKKK